MNNYLRGEKRICPFCATKFFDLNRPKIDCPKCNKEIVIESLTIKTIPPKINFSEQNQEKLLSEDKKPLEDNFDDDNINEDDNNSTLVNIDE